MLFFGMCLTNAFDRIAHHDYAVCHPNLRYHRECMKSQEFTVNISAF